MLELSDRKIGEFLDEVIPENWNLLIDQFIEKPLSQRLCRHVIQEFRQYNNVLEELDTQISVLFEEIHVAERLYFILKGRLQLVYDCYERLRVDAARLYHHIIGQAVQLLVGTSGDHLQRAVVIEILKKRSCIVRDVRALSVTHFISCSDLLLAKLLRSFGFVFIMHLFIATHSRLSKTNSNRR